MTVRLMAKDEERDQFHTLQSLAFSGVVGDPKGSLILLVQRLPGKLGSHSRQVGISGLVLLRRRRDICQLEGAML